MIRLNMLIGFSQPRGQFDIFLLSRYDLSFPKLNWHLFKYLNLTLSIPGKHLEGWFMEI